jgi:hypothetical protein
MQISPANLLSRIMKLEGLLLGNNGETWHTASMSGSGWSASGSGFNGVKYRMSKTGDLVIGWDITASAGPGTVLVTGTLPSGYYSTTHNVPIPTGWVGGPTTYNGSFIPTMSVNSDGGMSASGIFVTGLRCFGCATIPTDF